MTVPASTMIRLVSELLELSATEFSFPLSRVVPDVEERRAIVRNVHAAFPHLGAFLGVFDPERTYDTWSAWHLARYCATTCAAEAATFEIASTSRLSDNELLNYMGTDAQRWAEECINHAHATDKVDAHFLMGWFANAIERARTDERARVAREMLEGDKLSDSLNALGGHAPRETAELDGLETDAEFRARIKRDQEHGVGPGTEFPNLTSGELSVIRPDGTKENVGIAIMCRRPPPNVFVDNRRREQRLFEAASRAIERGNIHFDGEPVEELEKLIARELGDPEDCDVVVTRSPAGAILRVEALVDGLETEIGL